MGTTESDKGKFFAVDSRVWAKVTASGLNPAVAYLVLACGTGRDNRSTKWSTNAVKKHAGVGWVRAKDAIVRLTASGFIRPAGGHTEERPHYELATYRELVEFECAKAPSRDCNEELVLSDLRAGKQPTRKTQRNRADSLCKRGLLLLDVHGSYKLPELATDDPGKFLIWLPNTVVTGTPKGEEPPLLRLRSAGCVWTLRLFVDLYDAQNLRDDGGISRHIIRRDFDRKKIGEQGAYTVWGFRSHNSRAWFKGPLAAHEARGAAAPERESPVWESVKSLERMGLLSFVPHIFENNTQDAEAIHVYGIGGTAEVPAEREIGRAADKAASAMCLPDRLAEADSDGFEHFCPVQSIRPEAQMIGVARFKYRPRTRRTRAWFSELHQTSPGLIELFKQLTQRANEIAIGKGANWA